MNKFDNYQQIIDSCSRRVTELKERIERSQNMLTGTPWVIQCSPGMYLVAEKKHLCGGHLLGRVLCYPPEKIDAAVEHIRDHSDGVFNNARKITYREALEVELAAMRDLIDEVRSLQAVCA